MLNNLRVGVRLGISFLVIVILMWMAVGFSLSRIVAISKDARNLYNHPYFFPFFYCDFLTSLMIEAAKYFTYSININRSCQFIDLVE